MKPAGIILSSSLACLSGRQATSRPFSLSLFSILATFFLFINSLNAQNKTDRLAALSKDTAKNIDNPENLKAFLEKRGDKNLSYYTLNAQQKKNRTWLIT
ncbi:MAG TPA: hypothetical protein VFV31_10305, partial [Chitinophagaceae bacterium]|nr:hypothetical protein [Chitinophagaceae bacterium]